MERRLAGLGVPATVVVGMRYGSPSVATDLRALRDRGCERILVLPRYPQYSAPSVGSLFGAVAAELVRWRRVPELRTIAGYHDEPSYIGAVAASIREHWAREGTADRLLFSFHGLPVRYARAGDPYPEQCAATARLTAAALGLGDGAWALAYQSRFRPGSVARTAHEPHPRLAGQARGSGGSMSCVRASPPTAWRRSMRSIG